VQKMMHKFLKLSFQNVVDVIK